MVVQRPGPIVVQRPGVDDLMPSMGTQCSSRGGRRGRGRRVVAGAVVADAIVVGGVGEDAELEDAFVSVTFDGDA